MDMAVKTASRQNMAFGGNGLGAGADDDVHIWLGIRVAGFADAADHAVLQPDICLVDAGCIHHQRIGDHRINRPFGTAGL
ncbi:MAG: Uncharacterised protein [SAR116 cluster bacterium]|nr:MAG: Uncharacterised protein [SAR116 cluster bacterium]